MMCSLVVAVNVSSATAAEAPSLRRTYVCQLLPNPIRLIIERPCRFRTQKIEVPVRPGREGLTTPHTVTGNAPSTMNVFPRAGEFPKYFCATSSVITTVPGWVRKLLHVTVNNLKGEHVEYRRIRHEEAILGERLILIADRAVPHHPDARCGSRPPVVLPSRPELPGRCCVRCGIPCHPPVPQPDTIDAVRPSGGTDQTRIHPDTRSRQQETAHSHRQPCDVDDAVALLPNQDTKGDGSSFSAWRVNSPSLS